MAKAHSEDIVVEFGAAAGACDDRAGHVVLKDGLVEKRRRQERNKMRARVQHTQLVPNSPPLLISTSSLTWSASMATATGCPATAAVRALSVTSTVT